MSDKLQQCSVDQAAIAPESAINGIPLPDHSLRKRYVFKLGTSVSSLVSNVLIQSVVLRALGPALFGNFSYLTSFFVSVTTLLDGGSAAGFYNKLNQRLEERGLIRFYWEFVFGITFFCIVGVTLVLGLGWADQIWPDIDVVYIWLGMAFAIITLIIRVASYIMDAYGLTVMSEMARMVQNLFGMGILLLLFALGYLTLGVFFIYSCGILCGLLVAWAVILRQHHIALFPRIQLSTRQRKDYLCEFYRYASPLFLCTAVAMIIELANRWLLQTVAGSVEQGYFGLARNLAIACFMFTGAMTPLIMRDFSQAFARKDWEQMRLSFKKYTPMMYLLSSYFGMFTLVHAKQITVLFGGEKYTMAAEAVCIMALYPIHQTYGQMNGSLMLATNRTRVYAVIAILSTLLSLPVMVYLVGPRDWGCLEMGAVGLAYCMVICQCLGVEIELWFNARFLKISFFKLLIHQLLVVLTFGLIAWLCHWLVSQVQMAQLFSVLISGLFYTILIERACRYIPGLAPIPLNMVAMARRIVARFGTRSGDSTSQ